MKNLKQTGTKQDGTKVIELNGIEFWVHAKNNEIILVPSGVDIASKMVSAGLAHFVPINSFENACVVDGV